MKISKLKKLIPENSQKILQYLPWDVVSEKKNRKKKFREILKYEISYNIYLKAKRIFPYEIFIWKIHTYIISYKISRELNSFHFDIEWLLKILVLFFI